MRSYFENWGEQGTITRDIADLTTANLLGVADLCRASLPCMCASLAGKRKGWVLKRGPS